MPNRYFVFCLIAFLVWGCEEAQYSGQIRRTDTDTSPKTGGTDENEMPSEIKPTLQSIIIEPENQILEVDLNSPSSQPFSATARYSDNSEEDISDAVVWSHSNSLLGTFNGPSLEIPTMTQTAAEVTLVTAKYKDLEATAQLTVVSYRKTGLKTDFFFVLPYNDPNSTSKVEQEKPLEFKTDVKSIDVFFAMDTTASMTNAIQNLQNSVTNILAPSLKQEIEDTRLGAGSFEDFPVDPFGYSIYELFEDKGYLKFVSNADEMGQKAHWDQPFTLFQEITDDVSLVQAAVNQFTFELQWQDVETKDLPTVLPIGDGRDVPEAMIEAFYQIATGEGLNGPGETLVSANNTGVGGVGFRPDSMPIIVPISDSPSHAFGNSEAHPYSGQVAGVAHSRVQAEQALEQICAKIVGIAGEYTNEGKRFTALNDEEHFATTTGARVPPEAWDVTARPAKCGANKCCTGVNGAGRSADADGLCPLVFKVTEDGQGVSESIVTGIKMLTSFAAFDVVTDAIGQTTDLDGHDLPQGITTAMFIKEIIPDSFEKTDAPPVLPDPQIVGDSFKGVTPGTKIRFYIKASNDSVPDKNTAQLFKATIKILAGGCTALDEREVFILVPPTPIVVV